MGHDTRVRVNLLQSCCLEGRVWQVHLSLLSPQASTAQLPPPRLRRRSHRLPGQGVSMDSSHFLGPERCQPCKRLFLPGPGSRLRAMWVLTTGSPDRGTCAVSTMQIPRALVVCGTRMSSFLCHLGQPRASCRPTQDRAMRSSHKERGQAITFLPGPQGRFGSHLPGAWPGGRDGLASAMLSGGKTGPIPRGLYSTVWRGAGCLPNHLTEGSRS